MAYTKQVWRDLETGGTPITAERLNHIEDGIEENSNNWDSISQTSAYVTYSGNFKNYNSSGNNPSVTRQGCFVYLEGCMTPTKTLNSTNDGTIAFTIPYGFRPKQKGSFLQQGSYSNKWQMIVESNGTVSAARYSTSSYTDIEPTTYMPFSACWVTGDDMP